MSGSSDNDEVQLFAPGVTTNGLQSAVHAGSADAGGTAEQSITLSTVFHPNADLVPAAPDAFLLSSDRVFFSVHSAVLVERSTNRFNFLFPPAGTAGLPVLAVPEDAHALNVVLHTVYGLPCAHFRPSDDALRAALAGLRTYGVALGTHAAPGTPLFALLAGRTPAAPLAVYTLAAEHDLRALAAHASRFLLSVSPAEIDAASADRMGPLYLARLLALQSGRVRALREILWDGPGGHPPTDTCDEEAQHRVGKAWEMTAAYLIWEGRPELTATSMEVTFESVATSIKCAGCREMFNQRVAQVVQSWAQLPRTI